LTGWQGITWVLRAAIGAFIVPGNFDEFLEDTFILVLLALGEGRRHGEEASLGRPAMNTRTKE
jgi:hypothetical protein